MSLASRGTRAAARTLRQPRQPATPRRYASDSHGAGHDHAHGHGESALHLKNANTSGNESMGMGFYTTLAAVPLFYIGYQLSYGSNDSWVNNLFQKYKEGSKATFDAAELNAAVMQQAILDRARLASFPREVSGPNLSFQELFNTGSPWNQAAGESCANLKELEEYYRKLHAQAEDERLERMKDGKKSVYER